MTEHPFDNLPIIPDTQEDIAAFVARYFFGVQQIVLKRIDEKVPRHVNWSKEGF